LGELVTEGMRHKLTLISALVGFGKTTLLSEWRVIHLDSEYPLTWVSLEEADNDSTRFLSYLIPPDRLKPGRPALLSQSEILTLAILAQWPRFRSERDFWRYAQGHLRSYFPKLVSPEGVVTAFFLAPAACDERPIGEVLIQEDRHGNYLADKGFSSLAWERYGALVATPSESSLWAWPVEDRRLASGKRQVIEEMIGRLEDLFGLERHRAKTLGGLLTRLAAKIAAYTYGQRLNALFGRPLRHLADLLV